MPEALTRPDPFAELGELRSRFDRMSDELTSRRERAWAPALDLARDYGNLIVDAEILAIKPEAVRLRVRP
jgi:HSP20 family molecular chaperone IbpA